MTYNMVKVIKIPKGIAASTYNETKSQSCVWNIDPGNIWKNHLKKTHFMFHQWLHLWLQLAFWGFNFLGNRGKIAFKIHLCQDSSKHYVMTSFSAISLSLGWLSLMLCSTTIAGGQIQLWLRAEGESVLIQVQCVPRNKTRPGTLSEHQALWIRKVWRV